MDIEQVRFMEVLAQTGNIAASSKKHIDLSTLYAKFGHNFNTLIIINTDSTATKNIGVWLDGKEVMLVLANNGIFNFDWQDGIIYSTLAVDNKDGANVLDSANIKIFVGRTGRTI